MPAVAIELYNRGNETTISNLKDVAKALRRPPDYVLAYLAYELGTQPRHNRKIDRYGLSGRYPASTIQDALDGFVRRFVLCPTCDNPETDISVDERVAILSLECKACGEGGVVKNGGKLTKYVLNKNR